MKEIRGGSYRDGRAPDGIFSDGLRLVRKGGRIKAAGRWFSGQSLSPFVGQQVFVMNMDYWSQDIQAFQFPGMTLIGTLKVEP